ncbi:protein of unknown function [Pseudomonas inefficax]|uniref:Uncharacterized protein n=1 Tax=Pseudomonas inefficax TaxID=2078786 RepID=A0AAQ1SUL4_9PSED|nr:protein of unknown function [Pseudomonas inefficax]
MARGGVQPPLAEAEQAAAFADGQVGRQHARAAQHGVDTGQQFAGRERLGQVIVGAHFQADDTVGFVVAGGQHQHRGIAVLAGAQFAAQQQAVVAGHHDVEDDQVHAVGFEKGAHLPAVGDDAGAQAVLLQVVADQFADFAVVVDDQDVIDMFHALRSCAKGMGAVYRARSRLPAGLCIAVYLAYVQTQEEAHHSFGRHMRDTWPA